MKRISYIITTAILTVGIYACNTSKNIVSNSKPGTIELDLQAVLGKDSLLRMPNGDTLGKIDKDGVIYDLEGNKIGKKKLTDAELIKQAGF